MTRKADIGIIGGGLAGLTAAIHLSKQGFSVLLFEKNQYPKHKVCGEFISNEVLPYLLELGLDIESLAPSKINTTTISIPTGKEVSTVLPMGGFGISRFSLDHYLYQKALESGCVILNNRVAEVQFEKSFFRVETSENESYAFKIVLGSFGKRSNLDLKLKRDFSLKKSPWLAMKAHYSGEFPNNLVALHNFEGGYCGISKVENDIINICYLVEYKTFKKYATTAEFEENVLKANPYLKSILENSTPLFEKPLSISQISFEDKKQVENHILMIGDTAGLIHPLCGNGMAMAIHSAKIASQLVSSFLKSTISRAELEERYCSEWKVKFGQRIRAGRLLSRLLLNPLASKLMMGVVLKYPQILSYIIQKTHGKPII